MAIVLGILIPEIGYATAGPKWTDYDRPAGFELVRDENVPIRMSEGATLRANVDRPDAGGRSPVLLTQTPYGKDGGIGTFLGGTSEYLAERGYVVVVVDVRGTGASEGQWDSFGPREQRDGYELVEWAAAQAWSIGKVGLIGPSYMGLNQLLTAAQRPPHLKAIFPIVPMADAYRDITFSGGELNTAFIPLWLGLVTAGGLTPTPSADDPSSALAALIDHVSGVLSFQLPTVLEASTGGDLAYDGPFWETRSPLEGVDRIRVPAFVVGGLHDLFQRGEPLVYERLKRHVPARLLVGPWTHVAASTGQGLPRDGVPALTAIELRWFDRWLYGMNTHIKRIPRVTQFSYGRDRYVTERDWPNPRLAPKRRYLRGGGALRTRPPADEEAPQTFLQNPTAGVCTQSTAQWTGGLGDPIPCTQNGNAEGGGAATYTTRPLPRRLELSGPILANLWVRTSASEAVVTVRVKDVAPDSTATELTAGWLSGSFRGVDRSRSRYVRAAKGARVLLQPWHPFTRESVRAVEPGEAVRLPVEIFPTRATLEPGHRLRITVSGGDFPHSLPPLPQLASALGGRVEVLTDPRHRSYLELPALRRECRGHCKPLPVPNLIRGA
jgi:putative CocE/NonD family hydrolase